MKHISKLTTGLFLLIFHLSTFSAAAQQEMSGSDAFWERLSQHCGKTFAGEVTTPMGPNDQFAGKTLVMHVRSCDPERITIPFFVGEDKSRTWVLTREAGGRIKLKHDHRHEDGSEDEITQYGGVSANTGMAGLQFFPADQETADLIPYAANNVWWITVDDKSFTYNLRRVGAHANSQYVLT
ncbi:secreted protein [Nitritalea halalkaliphila LW7]|uniref:Secreted protein n=1 Tax=Nitritalea halalkaliphila LW7 TaxID=1189621 RepID=I5BWF6_9BACT|nr:hypothetical protein [Nitritalea halalkaliphila]EIM73908.1 secreted protein [Nitritalea halalkaliphila LW7]